ncbi:hypothetical protein MERGE_001875 [Pneumocystis wakefieldiae]|uniref:Uncharacterized protein n=1 Tax=Pneumocystis wakefieldiae TaxID=38082 RepID=A0A899FW92_9ASCO|nr:hypothetical protein MERGE_001875 [Pneumocystis wakefieldiae]
MAARARADKGRFIAGNTELDIVPQKWKQEWTLCWVPVKDIETSESAKTAQVEDASNLAEAINPEENKEP